MTHDEIQAKAESELTAAEQLASGTHASAAEAFGRHVKLAEEWMSLLSILTTPPWTETPLPDES